MRLRIVLLAMAFLMIAYAVVSSVAPKSLTPVNMAVAAVAAVLLAILVDRRRRDGHDEGQDPPATSFDTPGKAYEDACKAVLTSEGWRIAQMAATRDPGADIYALRGASKLLIQCRDYRGMVGYSAVAQLKAAQASYPAAHLCVVAPCAFSSDAETAGQDLGVKLLHHDDLRRYAKGLG